MSLLNMKKLIIYFDQKMIYFLRRVKMPIARFALFTVFFWFGFLKVLGTSPAHPLVADLLRKTLPFISLEQFMIFFGIYEMAIGIIFLIPKLERLAMALLLPHIVTTFLPLVLLPSVVWQGFLTPTLEGQYIIKNLAIIALVFGVASELSPWQKR